MDVTTAWIEHRRDMLDLAFRMLGDIGESEDVVQEAFTRLSRDDVHGIDDVRGWLIVAVSRRCLDQLRSARWSRVVVRDPSLNDSTSFNGTRFDDDPQDRVTLDESVREALVTILERLSPAERTAFVLHDVFGLTFVVERFIAACSTGDLEALLGVLADDAAGQADFGGSIGLAPPVLGRQEIAPRLLFFVGPDSGTTIVRMPVFDGPGVIGFSDGVPRVAILLTIDDDRVHHIHAIVDPVKLRMLDV